MWSITPRPAAEKTASEPRRLGRGDQIRQSRTWPPLLAIVILLAASWLAGSKYLTCQVFYRDDVNVRDGQAVITAQAAKTPAEFSLGLGGRQCIGQNQGMLFEFNRPGRYAFWMKGMRFPIDMVWISADKKVVYAKPYVSPDTYPQAYASPQPAQYVLEMAAGRAAQLGLGLGTQLSF